MLKSRLLNSVVLFFFLFRLAQGRSNSVAAEIICRRIPGLTAKQQEMCFLAPDAVAAIGAGLRLGFTECENLFRSFRWNCSSILSSHVFTHVVVLGSKEAAFTYSISSAGATYSLAKECSRGSIPSCGCDPSRQQRRENASSKGWKWGGCSADINYSMKIARKFLDARELEGDARSMMNLHNNKAGRKAVKDNLQVECKCHGVSGSCTMRTCWETLPPFTQIGETIMKKYRRAKPVVAVQLGVSARSTSSFSRVKLVLRKQRSTPSNATPKRSELVFLQWSPTYCDPDPAIGSKGTAGRICNRTSRGADGCDALCCGRGYNTHQTTKVWQCRCRFQWCCTVSCDTCKETIDEHYCK